MRCLFACLLLLPATPSHGKPARKSATGVDWLNHTYSTEWTHGPRKHVGGRWAGAGPFGGRSTVRALVGDVTGDGVPDAVLRFSGSGGGSGRYTMIQVRDGADRIIGRIPGGDRADGGVRNVRIEGGAVHLDRASAGPLGGACCPAYFTHEVWRWDGKQFAAGGRSRLHCAGLAHAEPARDAKLVVQVLEAVPDARWSVREQRALQAIVCAPAPKARIQALLGRDRLLMGEKAEAQRLLSGAVSQLDGEAHGDRAAKDLKRATRR